MTRRLPNWITSYLAYTENTESPRLCRFWAAISTIASALRRHVWFDMGTFKWYPSFYIVLVGPPGVITKSTTLGVANRILKQVPGINYGADITTWQSLLTDFSEIKEEFPYGAETHRMSALTVISGELGSLLNPKNDESRAVDTLIELWDGKDEFRKNTKHSGKDFVIAPWINIIGCTTPSWIADNVPRSMIGGGFVSRCVFVFRDRKENIVTIPRRAKSWGITSALEPDLVHDLQHIAERLIGPIQETDEAYEWLDAWDKKLWEVDYEAANSELLRGFLARKQGHLVKTAMILSVAKRDDLTLRVEDLEEANKALNNVELSLGRVFSRIGTTELGITAGEIVEIIRQAKRIKYWELYRQVYSRIPDSRTWEAVLMGAKRSGQITLDMTGATKPEDGTIVYTGTDE